LDQKKILGQVELDRTERIGAIMWITRSEFVLSLDISVPQAHGKKARRNFNGKEERENTK